MTLGKKLSSPFQDRGSTKRNCETSLPLSRSCLILQGVGRPLTDLGSDIRRALKAEGNVGSVLQEQSTGCGEGPWTPLCMQQLQAVSTAEQGSMQCKDEMLGFTAAILTEQSLSLHRYASVGVQEFRAMKEKRTQCDSCCAPTHQEFLRTMGMAVIRFEGEKKSWSEQNKERVWAAVTSCFTNVPPTLRSWSCCCCCPGPLRRLLATKARNTVAWGGFLATLSSEHTQSPEFLEAPSWGDP